MTLIIAAGCLDYTIIVSDRRFTYPGERSSADRYHDEKNKVAVVRGSDFDLAIVFTGLTVIAGLPTIEWVMNSLCKAEAPLKGLADCAEAIRAAAESAWTSVTAAVGDAAPQGFVLAASRGGTGQVGLVSNYRAPDLSVVQAQATFRTHFVTGKYAYLEDGAIEALQPSVKKLIKASLRKKRSYHEVIDRAVREIRTAALHPRYGRFVGKECMSICMFPNGSSEALYHPTHGLPVSFSPAYLEVMFENRGMLQMGEITMGGNIGPVTLGQQRGGLQVFDRRATTFETLEQVLARAIQVGDDGQNEQALLLYNLVLQKEPTNAAALYGRGIALSALGQHDQALSAFDRLLEIKGEFGKAHYVRAQQLVRLDRFDEALTAIDRAIQFGEHTANAHSDRSSLLRHAGRHEEAIESATCALELEPESILALNNRGAAWTALRKYKLALTDYLPALQVEPNNAITLYNRACLYSQWKKRAKAIGDLRRAIEADPKNRDQARTDPDFDNIRDDPRFQELVGEGETPKETEAPS